MNSLNFFFFLLKAGPLENIIRKEDRNGNLICLIIYKHVQSCDYAIKLFNGITLFNTSLKVQQSQTPGAPGSQNKRPAPTQSNYANLNDRSERDRARMNRRSMSYEQQGPSPGSPRMLPPQRLNDLMGQQFAATASLSEFGIAASNQFQNPYSEKINQSISGTNLNFDENKHHHQSRRNRDYNQSGRNDSPRGYSNENRDSWRSNANNSHNGYSHQQHGQQRNSPHGPNKHQRNLDGSRSPQRKRNRF